MLTSLILDQFPADVPQEYHKRYAALTRQREITFKETPEAVWQDFKAGKIDIYNIGSDQLLELEDFLHSKEYFAQEERNMKIQQVDYTNRSYNYIGWNQARPFFSNKTLRQAMTLAIDRNRIIRQNLNSMGEIITGPFFKNSPSYNTSLAPYPYDPDEALSMLEREGWYDSDGDGILDKEIDGQRVPFSFSLTYYVKNPTTKVNSEYIATALKELGIECVLHGVDIADLSHAFDEKDFDALYLGWALGTPPEEPKQLWHSSGAYEKGSSNAVGFDNKTADKIIEELQYEYDKPSRVKMYHTFHRIIKDEAPYTFLYSPKVSLLHREYVKNIFIPAQRQDIIPGANVPEPSTQVLWLKDPTDDAAFLEKE